MKYHSQNREAEIAINYFKGRKGMLLEVGANNGKDLSNSYDMINLGWSAVLLEPSTVCEQLAMLHLGNPKVKVLNVGIGERHEFVTLFQSENHVPDGKDKALVSSVDFKETQKWREKGVIFHEVPAEMIHFEKFYDLVGKPKFNMISIDTEGQDWKILQQINLSQVGCELLIIEWNAEKELKEKFTNYCNRFRLRQIHQNAENLIFAKTP